jgi:hypothetical protein
MVLRIAGSIKESDEARGNLKILLAYFILLMSAAFFLMGLWYDVS